MAMLVSTLFLNAEEVVEERTTTTTTDEKNNNNNNNNNTPTSQKEAEAEEDKVSPLRFYDNGNILMFFKRCVLLLFLFFVPPLWVSVRCPFTLSASLVCFFMFVRGVVGTSRPT
jgi:hypothetical protein